MKSVTEINEERVFNNELMGLMDVMKSIAVFRFRTLQSKKRRFPEFQEALSDFFTVADFRKAKHPYLMKKAGKPAFVLVTSNEGFMGALNLHVIEAALRSPDAAGADINVVGERGARHLDDIGRPYTLFGAAETFDERYRLAMKLKDHVLKGAKEGKHGEVIVFYPRPVSFIIQRVEGMRILPFSLPEPRPVQDIIVESSLEGIIGFLIEEDVLYKFIEILEDSKLSEYAARALHLEESSRQLTDKEKDLKFQYFRAHHEIIDKNIRELFSAQVISTKG